MAPSESILFYSAPTHNVGNRLQSIVEKAVYRENIIIVRQVEQLMRILRQPLNGIVAAVIMVGSNDELAELMEIRDFLLRIPLILVLPDQERDTVTRGHVFRPRYLTYIDSDLTVVQDVFKKMVGRATGSMMYH